MYFYIADHVDDLDDNQGLFKSVVNKHTMLLTKLRSTMAKSHNDQLDFIKKQCLLRIKSGEDLELKKKITETATVSEFFDVLMEYKKHCNWLKIDLVETIVIASENKELVKLVEKYKDAVYSKTLQQVWEGIPSLSKEVKDECSKKIKSYFPSRTPSDVTMSELLTHKELPFEIAKLISEI